jgi:hypothetical protein
MRNRLLLVLPLAGMLACQPPEEGGWTPVLEEAPPAFLDDELARIGEAVESARVSLAEAPADAESALEEAAGAVAGLREVYLPLYRSRVTAANAYRQYELGRKEDALEAVESVNAVILDVSERTGGSLERELEVVAEHAARARVAVRGDDASAELHLRRLVETLADLVTRAGLVL